MINQHIEEQEEREAVRAEESRTQNSVDEELSGTASNNLLRGHIDVNQFEDETKKVDSPKVKLAQWSRHRFEATNSDDEWEIELEKNMNEIQQLSAKLNKLGTAMGAEINDQDQRIARLADKSTHLDTRIFAGTQKLEAISRK